MDDGRGGPRGSRGRFCFSIKSGNFSPPLTRAWIVALLGTLPPVQSCRFVHYGVHRLIRRGSPPFFCSVPCKIAIACPRRPVSCRLSDGHGFNLFFENTLPDAAQVSPRVARRVSASGLRRVGDFFLLSIIYIGLGACLLCQIG